MFLDAPYSKHVQCLGEAQNKSAKQIRKFPNQLPPPLLSGLFRICWIMLTPLPLPSDQIQKSCNLRTYRQWQTPLDRHLKGIVMHYTFIYSEQGQIKLTFSFLFFWGGGSLLSPIGNISQFVCRFILMHPSSFMSIRFLNQNIIT